MRDVTNKELSKQSKFGIENADSNIKRVECGCNQQFWGCTRPKWELTLD